MTPLKYLSIIVCEIGNVPPHSVPVVIREIMNDLDYDLIDVLDTDSESDASSEEESNGASEYGDWKVVVGTEEMKGAASEPSPTLSKNETETNKRKAAMAAMAAKMKMEEVTEGDESDY